MWEYKADLLEVVDGDTIDVRINLGFHIFLDQRVRLAGINCPETRTKDKAEKILGFLAKNELIKLLTGKELILKTEKEHSDEKFGRMLAVVWVDGVNVNNYLVENNFAVNYAGGAR